MTWQQAWALSQAISPRPVVRVADDGSGTYSTLYALSEDAPPPGVWAVLLAGPDHQFRLVCLDLDDGGDAAVAAMTPHLEALAIPYVVTASGKPGHRHIWFAVADPGLTPDQARLLAVCARRVCPSVDITPLCNPAAGCVRPPGSPHASGASSRVLHGDVADLKRPVATPTQVSNLIASLAAAANIPATAPTDPTPATSRTMTDPKGHPYLVGPRRPLAASAQQALQQPIARGQDASPVAWTVLLGAARARWRFADVLARVPAAPGLEHYRTASSPTGLRSPRSRPDQLRTLIGDWRRAITTAATTLTGAAPGTPELTARAADVATTVQATLDRAAGRPGYWARRAGASDRRVLLVIATLCLQTLQTTVEADTRTVAQLAGVGRQTAADALHRLHDAGFLTPSPNPNPIRGTYWTLRQNTPTQLSTTSEHLTWTQRIHRGGTHPSTSLDAPGTWVWRNGLLRDLTEWLGHAVHDIFVTKSVSLQLHKGLGLHAGNVYADTMTALSQAPSITLEQLQEHTGMLKPYLARYLAPLITHKLLRRSDLRRTIHMRPYARDQRSTAAAAAGVTGALSARRDAIACERLHWQWWLAELEWMATPIRQRRHRPSPGQGTLLGSPESTWPAYPRYRGRAHHPRARALVIAHAVTGSPTRLPRSA